MTTKVQIGCPENSHWSIKAIEQEMIMVASANPSRFEGVAGQYAVADWQNRSEHIIPPGDVKELYVHSNQRIVIEEVPSS